MGRSDLERGLRGIDVQEASRVLESESTMRTAQA